ncbi:MAG: glycosyltransferase family 39 protein [Solirubrobacteraceae bacterium]
MAIDTLRAPVAESPPVVTPTPAQRPRVGLGTRPRGGDWWIIGALAGLMLISAWLRTKSFNEHYWVDEGLSVGIASHPLGDIPSLLRQDGSPPLYYLILHAWMSWRGTGEVATHELSLIFAMLTIPVAYWFGAGLFGRRTGLVAATIAALSTYLTLYAQETRMYALLALLALIVAGSFVQSFIRRRRRYLPVFSLSLAASLYTHNWALFLGLMCGVAFLFCVYAQRIGRRALWRDGLIGFGVATVLYVPWLPTLVYQAKHTGAPWDLPPTLWSIPQGLYTLTGGRGAAVALLLAGGVGLLGLRETHNGSAWMLRAAQCLLILGVGTLLFGWLYSKITPAWAPRYLAVIVGPLILLFALGLVRAGALGIVALTLCACFWILDPQKPSVDSKSNVAAIVHRVAHNLPAGSLVLSTQPEQVPTIAYYLPNVTRYGTPLGPVIDRHIVDWRNALIKFRRVSVPGTLEPMLATLGPGQRVALVTPWRFTTEPPWMRLIKRSSKQWLQALEQDPRFVKIASSSADAVRAGVPVAVTVFERR